MAAVTGSIDERQFVVMRFERIKTWSHVYHVRRHNMREMECHHLEEDRPPNLIIGGKDVSGAIRRVLERFGIRHQPGEVLALEFVVSTSRGFFDRLEGEEYIDRLGEFVVRSLRAFSDRFKIPGQIVSAALHEDERTPHLHVVVVPLVCEPDMRRRDQTPFYRLSAKRVVGGRGDMSREQTRFATFFADIGLKRGKERSGARHISNREHEAMLEEARQAALAEREGLSRGRAAAQGEAEALAAERQRAAEASAASERGLAEIEATSSRLREQERQLAAERATLEKKTKEAEALKRRAITRMKKLHDLLVAGEQLRAHVLSLPVERRGPALQKAHDASERLAAASKAASADDAWMATMIAYRAQGGAGMAR